MNTTHPLIAGYLEDLMRMLGDFEPADRDEIVGGVRDHLVAAGEEGGWTSASVSAALARLGPPESVAAAARADLGGPASVPTPEPVRVSVTTSRGWARAAVILTSVSVVPALVGAAMAAVTPMQSSAGTGWPERMGLFAATGTELVVLSFLLAPVWLAGLVAALTAVRLSVRTRVSVALSGPVTLATLWFVLAALPTPGVAAALAAVVVTAAVGVVLGRAWRDAS